MNSKIKTYLISKGIDFSVPFLVDENHLEKIDEKFKKVDEKIIDSNFYFEENYGRKIDIIFEKLQLEDEKKDVKIKEFEEFKSQNNAKLLSHDVRITKLEKVVNSN